MKRILSLSLSLSLSHLIAGDEEGSGGRARSVGDGGSFRRRLRRRNRRQRDLGGEIRVDQNNAQGIKLFTRHFYPRFEPVTI